MKKHIATVLAIALLLTAATPAMAWQALRSGDKNFERGWHAMTNNLPVEAKAYFTEAATLFAEAYSEDPPSRSARFPTNRAKAGISYYYAQRYQECLDMMKLTMDKRGKLWEANLYAALAAGQLGDREYSLEQFKAFRETMASQRIISNALSDKLTALEKGEITFEEAITAIDMAVTDQFKYNVKMNLTPRNAGVNNERCSGRYWWRKNDAPCTTGGLTIN